MQATVKAYVNRMLEARGNSNMNRLGMIVASLRGVSQRFKR